MDSNHRLRDFRTTIVFTTLSVCGLDYTFTIPFGLGVPRLVSTPSSCDAWLGIAILQVSPNLRNCTHKVSQMRLNFHKSLASAAGLHGLVYKTIITQRVLIVKCSLRGSNLRLLSVMSRSPSPEGQTSIRYSQMTNSNRRTEN